MSGDGPLLDRDAINEAFRRLGERLARRGLIADVYVFGGAAMALAYDARRATRDIDAVFEPHGAGTPRTSASWSSTWTCPAPTRSWVCSPRSSRTRRCPPGPGWFLRT